MFDLYFRAALCEILLNEPPYRLCGLFVVFNYTVALTFPPLSADIIVTQKGRIVYTRFLPTHKLPPAAHEFSDKLREQSDLYVCKLPPAAHEFPLHGGGKIDPVKGYTCPHMARKGRGKKRLKTPAAKHILYKQASPTGLPVWFLRNFNCLFNCFDTMKFCLLVFIPALSATLIRIPVFYRIHRTMFGSRH